MNRWLLVFALVISGCVATLPDDDGVTADLACEAARQVVQMRRAISPSPAPASDACENCNGRGRVRSGDGLSEFTCPVCKGTGKKPKTTAVCTTGTCRP